METLGTTNGVYVNPDQEIIKITVNEALSRLDLTRDGFVLFRGHTDNEIAASVYASTDFTCPNEKDCNFTALVIRNDILGHHLSGRFDDSKGMVVVESTVPLSQDVETFIEALVEGIEAARHIRPLDSFKHHISLAGARAYKDSLGLSFNPYVIDTNDFEVWKVGWETAKIVA